jgi:hypothetical protein
MERKGRVNRLYLALPSNPVRDVLPTPAKTTPAYYDRTYTCITRRGIHHGRRGSDEGPRGRGKGRDPKGVPGTVVRAILPQGPHAHGERQRAESNERGGMGVPPWGFLIGGGASEGGSQGGKPRRGRRGTPFATAGGFTFRWSTEASPLPPAGGSARRASSSS